VLDRVVFDTTVIIAALRSERGASRVLLTEALGQSFALLASVPLMLEYEAVATRPEHLEAAGLAEADVREVLDALATAIEPVRLSYLWRPMLPDADDDMVLETAVNGRADCLVTVNRRDFVPGAAWFGVRVVSPAEALDRLRRV
jgi:putative PIN family toxin of toxin-antitoxin system